MEGNRQFSLDRWKYNIFCFYKHLLFMIIFINSVWAKYLLKTTYDQSLINIRSIKPQLLFPNHSSLTCELLLIINSDKIFGDYPGVDQHNRSALIVYLHFDYLEYVDQPARLLKVKLGDFLHFTVKLYGKRIFNQENPSYKKQLLI